MTRFVGTPVKGVEFANAGDEAISARVSGDSNARIRIDAGGRLTWGDGATAGDANLYRSDANTLKTDDTLYAVNGVITLTTVGAPTANLPDGAIAIDTSADSLYLRSQSAWVKAGGVELSTTAPTANVSDGDMWFDTDDGFLYVRNSGSWVSVTATLALNGISDVTITSATTGDFLTWNGTAWVNGAGDVAFNSVTLGSAPTQASHAATKSYVDNLAAGIDWHEAARLGTTSALPNAPTYGNGSSGEGATLTAGTQNRLVVDGANANTGDRILVKTQAVGYEDGVYSVTNQGASGSAAWVLTRADDFDGTQPGGIQPGEAVFVLNGSVNANQGFVVTSTNDPHTVGTDSITFTQFTGAQAFSAGAGLTKTGNTIDVVTADSGRIVVSADSVDLGSVSVGATSGSATQSFVSSVATDAYGRVTGVETSSLIQGLGTADSPSFTAVTSDVTGTVSDISNHNLNGISDVTIASAATGEFLKWNGTAWVNAAITGVTGIAALNDIGDVTIASATSGEILFWNGTAWVNDTIASVNQIDDVTITSAISGNILTHNGTNWINSPFTIQNAGGVSVSGETSGDVLLFNGSNYVNTAHTLANITNVTLTTEANGEFLKYNGSAWINASIPEINTLNDVGNVAITSATSGDVLKWSGTQWINSDILASPGLTGVPTAATASTTTSTTQIATTAFVQQELAALVEYSARLDRLLIERVARGLEQVYEGFEVTQDGVGSFNVVVAAGGCVIQGDDSVDQGMYMVQSTTAVTLPVPPSPVSGTRTDTVIIRVNDSQAGGLSTPADQAVIEVIEGTVLPDTSISLATIARTFDESAILDSAITDTRTVIPQLIGGDGDVIAYQPLLYRNDERSTELTYTGDDLTQVLEKDGATTVKQTDLTYTAGKLTSVVELADSITVTTALTYTGDNLTSTTRTVT